MKRPPGEPLDLSGALFTGALVIVFFAILLWRDPLLFWNDDYELSILPVFADVARSWSEGHLPLLSPYSWVCGNLAGEFQYGTFSVFINAAVVLIWKLPLSFPQQAAALSLAHLFVLAVGGFFLVHGRGLTRPLAVMVGLVTALNGWMVCWGATDWFGALGAFAWFPWAWWGLERALDPRRGPYRFLWPAPFVYLLITGGFPYTVGMLALLAVWLAIKSLAQTRNVWSIAPMSLGMLLGIGLAAPAWLALFDYLRGSAREVQDSASHFQWIVPLRALPGFILPAWTVNWADFSTRATPHAAAELACGFAPPVVLFWACYQHGFALVRRAKWELGLLAVVLLTSMLPSANVFRWSFRWLPFVAVVLALCAAEAAQLMNVDAALQKCSRFGFFLLVFVAVAMWLGKTAAPYGWPLLAATFAIAAAWLALAAKSCALPAVTFAALLATYLILPTNCGVPKYNLDSRLTSPAPLDPHRLYLSVYPAPERAYRIENQPAPFGTVVRPGSTSMWGGIRSINGYSPIRPAGVAREFDSQIHGEIATWAGSYFPEWHGGPDDVLAQIGVDGIIVARELTVVPKPESEWELVHTSDEGRVYHRRGDAFATIRPAIGSRATVEAIEDTRNRASARVEVPPNESSAQIVFSRPYFPGYRARFNGKELPVELYAKMTPSVEIPAGTSGTLILEYQPWWLVYGGTAAAISLLISGTFSVIALRTR